MKKKRNNESAQYPTASSVALRLVENRLERNPMMALAAHFAGVLLGLFRRPQRGAMRFCQGPAGKRPSAASVRPQIGLRSRRKPPSRQRGISASASAVAVVGSGAGKEVRHG